MGIFQQFPYTNFHEMNLDEIIKIMRQMQDEWDATKTEWASYKDFIDNYFENLDVSEEVLEAMRVLAADGTLNAVVDPTIVTAVGDWLADNLTPTTPAIDATLSISGAGADAKVTGDRLTIIENNTESKKDLIYKLVNGSYYRSSDGVIVNNASMSRTEKIPAINYRGLLFKSTATVRVQVLMFDENDALLDYSAVLTAAYTTQAFAPVRQAAEYIAFNVYDGSLDDVEIITVDSSKITSISYPYTGDDYIFIPGVWMNSNGNIASATGLSLLLCSDPKALKAFINSQSSVNAVCLTETLTVLASGSVYTATNNYGIYGRIYDIPSGTQMMAFNVTDAQVDGIGNYSNYVSFVRDGEGLSGKKILCLGDSLTWLDGQSGGYGGSTNMVGYQARLRKRGADVRSYGWSGYPYADLTDENPSYGIHNKVVTDALDVTGYDMVILMGGLNDMLYNAPLGTASSDYNSPNIVGDSFNGAISGIIKYIRDNNPTCKIYICTMTPSEALSRTYTKNHTYREAVFQNGEFWQVPVIDLYTLVNAHPYDDSFDELFYDVTHPNAKGMIRIGEAIAHFIENN